MVRQSKRLQVAASKAVTAVTASPPAKKRKSVVSTTQTAASAVSKTPPSAPAKKAKTDPKSAWGSLFSGQKGPKLERVRPKIAEPISPEIQARIDAYPSFSDVSKRSADAQIKLLAWNVNGLRAVLKRDESVHLRAFVAQEDPDILCLSETKICRDELQKLEDFLPQYEHQYWSCALKKGYASTAIFSKTKPLSIKDEIVVGDHESKGAAKTANGGKDQEGRFLALEFDKFWLVHTYVPNAGGKLERLDFRTNQWDKAMLREMKEMEKTKPVVWCGDLNVAHQEIDIHNPKGNRRSAGFTDEERGSFGQILESGFVDTFRHLHPDKVEYSYFGYRHNMRAKNKGWRLDYFVVSEALMANVRSSYIRSSVVGSDHLPVGLELGAQQQSAKWVLDLLDEDEDECAAFSTCLLGSRPTHGRSKPGGSRARRAASKRQDPHARTARLKEQYFVENPIHNSDDFRRRFRMSKELFTRIHNAVVSHDEYFVEKPDATGKLHQTGWWLATRAHRETKIQLSHNALSSEVS